MKNRKKHPFRDVPPYESKYARKVRQRQAEADKPRDGSPTKIEKTPTSQAVTQACPEAEMAQTVVEAVVTACGKGFFFLKTDTEEVIFLGLNIVKRSTFNFWLKKRTRIKCRIAPHPNGKGPRVLEILEIVSAEAVAS